MIVVDHHDSYTWNLVHLVAAVTGVLPRVVQHDEVSPDDLTKPYGVSAVNEVAPYGDQVMAELEIDDPGVPMEIYRRLGLPGTSIC